MRQILEREFKNYSLLYQDIREISYLYDIYNGPEQKWRSDETDYLAVVKISNYIKKLIKEEARFMLGKTPVINILNKEGDSIEELQKQFDDSN